MMIECLFGFCTHTHTLTYTSSHLIITRMSLAEVRVPPLACIIKMTSHAKQHNTSNNLFAQIITTPNYSKVEEVWHRNINTYSVIETLPNNKTKRSSIIFHWNPFCPVIALRPNLCCGTTTRFWFFHPSVR